MGGSFINQLVSRPGDTPGDFAVGDGATICYWSDRRACTVIEVSPSGRRLVVQEDRSVRLDRRGLSDWQDYSYEPDPDGLTRTFTLRKNGRWVQVGSPQHNGTGLAHGRDTYRDPSF